MKHPLNFFVLIGMLLPSCLVKPANLWAQNQYSDTTASWAAFWVPDETQVYTLDWVECKYQGQELLAVDSLREYIQIRVQEENPQDYRLLWRSREHLESLNQEEADNPDLLLLTDELGQFEKIEDEKALKAALRAYVTQELLDSLPRKQAHKARNLLSPDALLASYIQKVNIFFFPYGNAYNTRGIRFDTQFDNPINGAKIPGYYNFQLIDIAPELAQARLRIEKRFEPGPFKDILIQLVQKFSEEPLSQEEMERELQNFEAYETYEYLIDLPSGWQKEVSFTKYFQLGENKTILRVFFKKR